MASDSHMSAIERALDAQTAQPVPMSWPDRFNELVRGDLANTPEKWFIPALNSETALHVDDFKPLATSQNQQMREQTYNTGRLNDTEKARLEKERAETAESLHQMSMEIISSLSDYTTKMDEVIAGYDNSINEIEAQLAAEKAELAELEDIKPVTLNDGTVVYLDERTGQFVKMDDHGNIQELTVEQQAQAQQNALDHDGPIRTVQNQMDILWLIDHIMRGEALLQRGNDERNQAQRDRDNGANMSPDEWNDRYRGNKDNRDQYDHDRGEWSNEYRRYEVNNAAHLKQETAQRYGELQSETSQASTQEKYSSENVDDAAADFFGLDEGSESSKVAFNQAGNNEPDISTEATPDYISPQKPIIQTANVV